MSISTILLLVLFLTLSFFSKAKKVMEEQGAPQGHPATPGSDAVDAPEEDESSYFTYESDAENEARTTKAPNAQWKAPAPAVAPVADEPVRSQFDLRQAVISQVILNNKYIDEINQQNQ